MYKYIQNRGMNESSWFWPSKFQKPTLYLELIWDGSGKKKYLKELHLEFDSLAFTFLMGFMPDYARFLKADPRHIRVIATTQFLLSDIKEGVFKFLLDIKNFAREVKPKPKGIYHDPIKSIHHDGWVLLKEYFFNNILDNNLLEILRLFAGLSSIYTSVLYVYDTEGVIPWEVLSIEENDLFIGTEFYVIRRVPCNVIGRTIHRKTSATYDTHVYQKRKRSAIRYISTAEKLASRYREDYHDCLKNIQFLMDYRQNTEYKENDSYCSFPEGNPADRVGWNPTMAQMLKEDIDLHMNTEDKSAYELLTSLEDKFSGVKFLCHGTHEELQFDKDKLSSSHINVADEVIISALEGRLFFLNACESSTITLGQENLAERFMRAGAGAVIGVLDEIPIKRAIAFARRFFHYYLFCEKSGFEACRLTKLDFINNGESNPAFLLYAVYGIAI